MEGISGKAFWNFQSQEGVKIFTAPMIVYGYFPESPIGKWFVFWSSWLPHHGASVWIPLEVEFVKLLASNHSCSNIIIAFYIVLVKIYLLLTEFEVRTVSYETEFFPLGFMAQARSTQTINLSGKKKDP